MAQQHPLGTDEALRSDSSAGSKQRTFFGGRLPAPLRTGWTPDLEDDSTARESPPLGIPNAAARLVASCLADDRQSPRVRARVLMQVDPPCARRSKPSLRGDIRTPSTSGHSQLPRASPPPFEANTLEVRETVVRRHHGAIRVGQPRSTSGRHAGAPVALIAMLGDHLEVRGVVRSDGDELLFTSPGGGFLRSSNWVRRSWYPAAIAARLGRVVSDERTGRERYEGPRVPRPAPGERHRGSWARPST